MCVRGRESRMTPSFGLSNWKDVEDDKRGRGNRESDLGQVQSEMSMKYVSGGIKIGSKLEFQIKILGVISTYMVFKVMRLNEITKRMRIKSRDPMGQSNIKR